MASDKGLQSKIVEISKHIEKLQKQSRDDPDKVTGALTAALEELEVSLEELSEADEEPCQQNEDHVDAQNETHRLLTAVQEEKDHLEIHVKGRTAEQELANARRKEEIAEREEAEKAVKAEQKRFNDVLEMLPAYLVLLTPDYHVPFANRFFRERFGESHGRRCFEYMFGRSKPCEICETYTVLKTNAPHHWEGTGPDGRNYDIFDFPFTDTDGSTLIMETGIDITERKRAEKALHVRSLQQEVVARLGLQALAGLGPAELMDEAVSELAKTLGVEYTKVLELMPDGRELLLVSSIGWQEGLVGRATVGSGRDSQAGYTLLSSEPVIVDDLKTETRFSGPPLLHEHGVISGMSVVIPGHERPFGVLGVHTVNRRTFNADDVHFLQAIANLLAMVIERKRAEEALRVAGAYNWSLIEASLDPLVTIGPEGTITDVNAATEAVTGYSRRDLIGTDFSDYFTEPDSARAVYQQVFREGLVRDYALEIRHRNGHITPVLYNASVYRDDGGRVIGVFAAARDISERKQAEEELYRHQEHLKDLVKERTAELESRNTQLAAEIAERKRAEESLRESEQRFHDAIDNFPNVFVIYGPDRRILFVNSKGLQICGLSEQQMVGRRDEEIFPPEAINSYLPALKRAIETMRPQALERTRPASMGGQTIIVNIIPLLDEREEIRRILGITYDITERKQAEEDLRKARDELDLRVRERTAELSKANEELEILYKQIQRHSAELELKVAERTRWLEAANKELESFSYSVSHDLRAPLRAMDGFSRILQEDYSAEIPPEAQRYLQLVRSSAQQMGRLIDDLLAFSRLGRQPLNKQCVMPVSIVNNVLEEMKNEQSDRQIDIVVGDLPACEADPTLLKQVFVNLISNALKFTRKREAARIEIGCQQMNDKAVYFIKDNGAGFDMQYAHKLFGVFQRLHSADEYEGTGVGLANVQRIIHRHGGSIWAEGEVDKGATFYFTLNGGVLK